MHSRRNLDTIGTAEQPGSMIDRQDAIAGVKEYPFRVGQPVDIGNVALFLAPDESRMITGATIPADGGGRFHRVV
jgi:NAD(P)-dependent dehydrogenase (short-subunit alcohol dehydrogenase family)